jgi:hypothetical protein
MNRVGPEALLAVSFRKWTPFSLIVTLAEEDGWTPETLGRELGRIAAAAQGAV